ncbi:MAG: hypothetical protein FJ118_15880 [Deltaproteobacteria bacterium]|nr:hypothetical protein [Deltaproteobacteria bacterium]
MASCHAGPRVLRGALQVGQALKGWKVGDRVVSETRTGACGSCYICQSGFP